MGDKTRGLFHKFNVYRVDGTGAAGKKHVGCWYFVLDCDHDPHAKAALQAYSKSCATDYPLLAADLRREAKTRRFGAQPK
jgi:hypothetical protein